MKQKKQHLNEQGLNLCHFLEKANLITERGHEAHGGFWKQGLDQHPASW